MWNTTGTGGRELTREGLDLDSEVLVRQQGTALPAVLTCKPQDIPRRLEIHPGIDRGPAAAAHYFERNRAAPPYGLQLVDKKPSRRLIEEAS